MTTPEVELARIGGATLRPTVTMKPLVYHAAGKYAWEDKPRPVIQDPGDAIVRIQTRLQTCEPQLSFVTHS
jgi:hypothetical protein